MSQPPKMNQQDINRFLDIECVIIAAKQLGIIGEELIDVEKVNGLKDKIIKKSPEVVEKLEEFQKAYKEWFDATPKNNNGEISQKDINTILKKDKAREVLSSVCIQYRKDNKLSEI